VKLEFYRSNPGLTPAHGKNNKKLSKSKQKSPSVPLKTASRNKAYLKNVNLTEIFNSQSGLK